MNNHISFSHKHSKIDLEDAIEFILQDPSQIDLAFMIELSLDVILSGNIGVINFLLKNSAIIGKPFFKLIFELTLL